jgi:hypothetical protein
MPANTVMFFMQRIIGFAFVVIVLGSACSGRADRASIHIEPTTGPTPYSGLNANNNVENFQFAIVTDRTGGHRPGVFLDGIQKINLLQPEFVMSVGDLIEGYTEDTEELDRQWNEFNGFIDSLKAPFFYVPGNHDITNKVMEEKWKSLFGRTYYHFTYKDVLFLCLNSEDGYPGAGRGRIGDEQYEWIKKTLDENMEAKWTLVFMHQPLWSQEAETLRWSDVEKLLEPRKHTVFVGHLHSYTRYVRNNGKYFVLATTGGGSPLRGTQVGEFDHVVWVTMTHDGPVLANLLLQGIWDETVVTEEMRDFFGPLLGKRVMVVSPMMVNAERFSRGSTEIRITNDSDVPMEVGLRINPNTWFTPDIIERHLNVAPNSVEVIDLNLTGASILLGKAKPVSISAAVKYKPQNLPEIKLDYSQNIFPERKVYLPKARGPRVVDGDLSDWPALPYEDHPDYVESDPFSHTGDKADGSFRFGVAYDDKFVYIAASVTDDEVLISQDNRPYNQDGFHVNLDGRPEAVSAVNTSTGDALYIGHSPGPNGQGNESLYLPDRLPDETKAVTVRTSKGYDTEIAIPLHYITALQGEDWKTVRINTDITDFDRDYRHKSTIWWKPDWRDSDNVAGSGMFYRQ